MNAHTKQQQDKVFQTDFIDSQKSDPPFAHLLALSHIYICNWKYISDSVFVCFVVVLSACLQNTGIMLDFVALIWSVQLSACEQYVFVVGLVVTEK